MPIIAVWQQYCWEKMILPIILIQWWIRPGPSRPWNIHQSHCVVDDDSDGGDYVVDDNGDNRDDDDDNDDDNSDDNGYDDDDDEGDDDGENQSWVTRGSALEQLICGTIETILARHARMLSGGCALKATDCSFKLPEHLRAFIW